MCLPLARAGNVACLWPQGGRCGALWQWLCGRSCGSLAVAVAVAVGQGQGVLSRLTLIMGWNQRRKGSCTFRAKIFSHCPVNPFDPPPAFPLL
ncbi:hypothetical protein PoB_000166500 [Plakobranchus ocellatus]|uniref:Secreted protein n=1 Tax=Plakobranchus ocellatus TaxID=259542 RepID=A0AAV3XXN1_9GAST|nr:hypothetical protein PoB_000166500 [Plakobranchus ocellatus]